MVRRMGGIGLMVMVLAACVLLPARVQGAEFDVSKFNQEVGLRFAYGKNTQRATVRLYSLLPRWGIFLVPPGKSWGPFGVSFVVEGIASIAGAEEVGFEIGFTPMVKFSCLLFPSVLAIWGVRAMSKPAPAWGVKLKAWARAGLLMLSLIIPAPPSM